MGYRFFTLPNDYSTQLHNQIWELIQFGNGFTWQDVYFMPSRWRKFYFNKLLELKKEEKKETDKIKKNSKVKVKR